MDSAKNLPVAVIGAGPVGLAAAAHLIERGLEPLIFEAGPSAGAAIEQWRHIRLFSPWRFNIDAAAVRLLEAAGWEAPRPTALPYGGELIDRYLAPLAALPAISSRLQTGARVIAVTRTGMDKTHTRNREITPFVVRVQHQDGETRDHTVAGVIDASGTWSTRNPLGTSGLPAIGEDSAADRISSPLPDVTGRDRGAFAGRRVLVVGAGHSAANTLISLADLAKDEPGTRILWAVRGASAEKVYGGGDADGLPARGQLGARLRRLVEAGTIELHTGFGIASLKALDSGVTVESVDGRTLEADVVVPCTGFRPDLDILRELRLNLDPAVEAPVALGPLIDPEFHSCGTVAPHGARAPGPPGQGLLHRRHEVLRPCANLPARHRLRTGPLRRRRPGRRPRGRGHRPARTPRNRRLLLRRRHQLRRSGGRRRRIRVLVLRRSRAGARRLPHRTVPRTLRRRSTGSITAPRTQPREGRIKRMTETTKTPSVLFVCSKNGGKSQLAAGLMNHLADGSVTVHSAGTKPGQSLNPQAVESLNELGIGITGEYPKPVTDEVLDTADVVIVLGNQAKVEPREGQRLEFWDTDEPSERGIEGMERMRLVRDDIKARVRKLHAELTGD